VRPLYPFSHWLTRRLAAYPATPSFLFPVYGSLFVLPAFVFHTLIRPQKGGRPRVFVTIFPPRSFSPFIPENFFRHPLLVACWNRSLDSAHVTILVKRLDHFAGPVPFLLAAMTNLRSEMTPLVYDFFSPSFWPTSPCELPVWSTLSTPPPCTLHLANLQCLFFRSEADPHPLGVF